MLTSGKIYQKRFATLEEHVGRQESNTGLLFAETSAKRSSLAPVFSAPRRQGLWLPFIHQLMLLMTVPEFYNQIFNYFQPIRYTKVYFRN